MLLNNLRVNFINAGIGSENKKLMLTTSEYGANIYSMTIFDNYNYKAFREFEEVQIVSFSDVLNQFKSVYLVKIDCEGCEFEIFKSINSDNLNKIEHFMIEYHYKEPDEIVNLLKENGFNIEMNQGDKIGFIWADKIQI